MNTQNYRIDDDLESVIQASSILWKELKNTRIFITGGTGFFGCWLLYSILYLNKKFGTNIQAVVLTRNPHAFIVKAPELANDKEISLWQGDVRDFEFPKGQFSHVIHLATDTSQKHAQQSQILLDEIVTGTQRVLRFAVAAKAKKVLLTSSGAVYGEQPQGIDFIAEEYHGACEPSDIHSTYGQGKRFVEHLCALYYKDFGLETKIARCFAFVGPYMNMTGHFAIASFIKEAIENETIHINGDGSPLRSYLYAADMTVWLWAILINGIPNRPYNVGSNEAIDILSLANKVRNIIAPNKDVIVENIRADKINRNRYIPSIDRARKELGVDVWTSLELSIKKTAKWYLKNK
jgi:dTDP-glucose 4,6-dehydratase